MDASSKQPIAGAIVVAQWKGHRAAGMVEGNSVCYHVESAISDELGLYVLPAWKNATPTAQETRLRFEDLGVFAYKRGYEWVPSSREDRAARTVYARRFTGSSQDRMADIRLGTPCGAEDGSAKNLLPYFRELLLDAIAFREETGNDAPENFIRAEMKLLSGNSGEIDKNERTLRGASSPR